MASLVGALSVLGVGCDGLGGSAGDKPEGTRLIEGRLQIPDDDDIVGRQVAGLQMVALHVTADGGVIPFTSAVFDPAGQRLEAAFVINADGDVDVVLALQVPSGSRRGVGGFVGLYTFGSGGAEGDRGIAGTLVPAGTDDVDLGTLTFTKGPRTPADTIMRGSAGTSPQSQTDSDGDGLTNDVDDDDDDDGIPDNVDDDIAGDGIPDATQILSALADDDGDGVPDVMAP